MLLIFGGTSFAPLVSAAVLPVMLGTESLVYLIAAVSLTALILLSRRKRRRYDGQYFLMYLFWYGLGRAWIEGLRTDSLYLWNTEIRVSQALSIALALTGGVLLFLNRTNRRLLRGGDPQPEPDTNTETESQA